MISWCCLLLEQSPQPFFYWRFSLFNTTLFLSLLKKLIEKNKLKKTVLAVSFIGSFLLFNPTRPPPVLASATKLTTRGRHLHQLKIWSKSGTTCIHLKFCHLVAPLAMVPNLSTRLKSLSLPHCLGMPYGHYQLVLSRYLHQPESHQVSLQNVSELETEIGTHIHLDPTKMCKKQNVAENVQKTKM